jgi:cytochrome oxidase Cu insertion factor (SCO1/SenC/PrrC family)
MPRPTRSIALALALAVALAVAVAAVLVSSSHHGSSGAVLAPPGSAFDGAALPGAPAAPAFALVDEGGRRVTLASYRGSVVVLAFLYAGCGPACTVVAQQVRGALDDLHSPPPVLFVSVNPVADSPPRVRAFLRSVSLLGRVRYLSGPARALPGVWREYHVVTPNAGQAAFERALSVLLIDASGRERVLFQQEQLTPESLAHDIGRLTGRAESG